MESFFKNLKVHRIYQLHDETRARASLDIVDWIEGYYKGLPAQLYRLLRPSRQRGEVDRSMIGVT